MNSIIEFVQKYRKENPTGWRKWVFGSVVAIVTFVFVAVFVIRESLRQREIADLNHQISVLREEAAKNTADAQISDLTEQQEAHTAAAEHALEQAAELKNRVESLEAEHKANSDLIASLRSWEDIDARIR